MADADVVSFQISLPQMLDLALGTPEVGAVNFNILHNLLHILLYQGNLSSVKVEYRGDDANRLKRVVSSQKSSPTLYLQEYTITDGSGKSTKRNVDDATPTADVISADPDTTTTTGIQQTIGPGKDGEHQRVIFIEPIVDGATPTALGFKKLEQSVNELQQRFQALEELPTNPELVERLKGKLTDPISDVWQVINITKRLDASEAGIDKLTSMIQDVIKGGQVGTVGALTAPEDTEARLTTLETNVTEIGEAIKNLQIISSMPEEDAQSPDQPQGGADAEAGGAASPTDDARASQQSERAGSVQRTSNSKRLSINQLLGGVNLQEMNGDVTALKTEVSQLRDDLDDMKAMVSSITSGQDTPRPKKSEHGLSKDGTPRDRTDTNASVKKERGSLDSADTPRSQHNLSSGKSDHNIKREQGSSHKPSTSSQPSDGGSSRPSKGKHGTSVHILPPDQAICTESIQKLNDRIGKMEQEVAALAEKLNTAATAVESGGNELNELVTKIKGIETDVGKLNEMTDHLVDDRENREVNMNAVLEQIELLKTIKADKEDLEDALADKADAHAVHRKVSHDQFDAACDDLARGLEDAINKLGKQEMIWQQALDEVQRDIEGKVDKMEITPLRDFVSSRLKALQEKLWSIAEMKQETEAAGTKKLLRDVQCISCDKNVVMRTEDTGKYRAETLPCNVSIKPYLTYELDQVRKQQKRLPHSRNMLQFEAALQEESRRQRMQKGDGLVKTPRDHVCNRYCGGSHTVITPHQRVMRAGHFLDQWGPDIVQLTEGVVKGSDGKMYRGRPVKFDVCGPQNCVNPSEEKIQSTVVSTERVPSSTPRPRKSSFEGRRSSAEGRRRSSSSRKSSVELPTVPLKEMMDDARIRPLEQMEEEEEEAPEEMEPVDDQAIEDDVLPIDPLDHPDEVIRYDDDETDNENENENDG